MTTEEMILVMQAYVEGEHIQVNMKESHEDDEWELTSNPVWDWSLLKYRIAE